MEEIKDREVKPPPPAAEAPSPLQGISGFTGQVLCFGEVMIRLSLPADSSWLKEQRLHANLAGAECNVAVALAKWGIPVNYCTALPNIPVTSGILEFLQEKNINTSLIQISGSRVGLMYVREGSDFKEGGVRYDRRYSSFADITPGTLDWDAILHGMGWVHFTAISPALNEITAAVCEEGIKAARSKGIIISLDLNYRQTLWKYGKLPVDVMPRLAQHCDIIMGNIWSANTLLGIPLDEALVATNTKQAYLQHAKETSQAIQHRFASCKMVALTFRMTAPPTGILYYASLFADGQQFASSNFTTDNIIDKIGSGDCFMAGLIFALRNGYPLDNVIEFAAAAAFGKLHEKGDFTNQTVENINHIITQHAAKK